MELLQHPLTRLTLHEFMLELPKSSQTHAKKNAGSHRVTHRPSLALLHSERKCRAPLAITSRDHPNPEPHKEQPFLLNLPEISSRKSKHIHSEEKDPSDALRPSKMKSTHQKTEKVLSQKYFLQMDRLKEQSEPLQSRKVFSISNLKLKDAPASQHKEPALPHNNFFHQNSKQLKLKLINKLMQKDVNTNQEIPQELLACKLETSKPQSKDGLKQKIRFKFDQQMELNVYRRQRKDRLDEGNQHADIAISGWDYDSNHYDQNRIFKSRF